MFNLSNLNPTIQTESTFSFNDSYNESRKYSLSSSEFDSLSQLTEVDLNNIKYVQIGQKNVRKNLNNVSDFATFRVNKTTSNNNIVLNGVSKLQQVNKNYWTGFKGGEYDIEMQLIYTPILASSTINRQYRLDKSNSKLIIKELRPNIAKQGSSPRLRNSVYLPYLSFITTNNVNGNHNNTSSGSSFTTSPSPTTPSRPTSPSNPTTTTHPHNDNITINTTDWTIRQETGISRDGGRSTGRFRERESFTDKRLNSSGYTLINPNATYTLEEIKNFKNLIGIGSDGSRSSISLKHTQSANIYTITTYDDSNSSSGSIVNRTNKMEFSKDRFIFGFTLSFTRNSQDRWELHISLSIRNDVNYFYENLPQDQYFKIDRLEIRRNQFDDDDSIGGGNGSRWDKLDDSDYDNLFNSFSSRRP